INRADSFVFDEFQEVPVDHVASGVHRFLSDPLNSFNSKFAPNRFRYLGIEGVEWIAKEAMNARRNVIHGDFLEFVKNKAIGPVDYVVALGTIANQNSLKDAKDFIKGCKAMAKKGVVISHLVTDEYQTDEGHFHAPPGFMDSLFYPWTRYYEAHPPGVTRLVLYENPD
nr:hypothetical protein [Myxococcota bacterium]